MSVAWRRRTGLFIAGMLWTLLVSLAIIRLGMTAWWQGGLSGSAATVVCRSLYKWWIA